MADLKINTEYYLDSGREFDIFDILSSEEMAALRAGFEPVPPPTEDELNAMFSWYESQQAYLN